MINDLISRLYKKTTDSPDSPDFIGHKKHPDKSGLKSKKHKRDVIPAVTGIHVLLTLINTNKHR